MKNITRNCQQTHLPLAGMLPLRHRQLMIVLQLQAVTASANRTVTAAHWQVYHRVVDEGDKGHVGPRPRGGGGGGGGRRLVELAGDERGGCGNRKVIAGRLAPSMIFVTLLLLLGMHGRQR